MSTSSLDAAAHVVQLALTPIFLLTGVSSMLSVFTTRLGRVADRVAALSRDGAGQRRQLERLRIRSRILDVAVVFASLAGILTCCAALTLFVGAVRHVDAGAVLFALFGAALICAVLALLSFSLETLISGRTVREQAESDVSSQGGAPL